MPNSTTMSFDVPCSFSSKGTHEVTATLDWAENRAAPILRHVSCTCDSHGGVVDEVTKFHHEPQTCVWWRDVIKVAAARKGRVGTLPFERIKLVYLEWSRQRLPKSMHFVHETLRKMAATHHRDAYKEVTPWEQRAHDLGHTLTRMVRQLGVNFVNIGVAPMMGEPPKSWDDFLIKLYINGSLASLKSITDPWDTNEELPSFVYRMMGNDEHGNTGTCSVCNAPFKGRDRHYESVKHRHNVEALVATAKIATSPEAVRRINKVGKKGFAKPREVDVNSFNLTERGHALAFRDLVPIMGKPYVLRRIAEHIQTGLAEAEALSQPAEGIYPG